MDELLEHEAMPDQDDRPDLPQRQPGRFLQGLQQRLAPLPEEAWVHRQPIQDEADPQATQTSDRSDDDSLFDPSGAGVSTGSTDAKDATASFRRGTAKVYGMLAGAFAAAAAGLINYRMRQDEDDTTWLMTQDEVEGVGEPIGRIAARKAPLPVGDGETNDVIDGMQVGIVLVGYVMRSLMERSERRRGPQAANLLQQTEQAA